MLEDSLPRTRQSQRAGQEKTDLANTSSLQLISNLLSHPHLPKAIARFEQAVPQANVLVSRTHHFCAAEHLWESDEGRRCALECLAERGSHTYVAFMAAHEEVHVRRLRVFRAKTQRGGSRRTFRSLVAKPGPWLHLKMLSWSPLCQARPHSLPVLDQLAAWQRNYLIVAGAAILVLAGVAPSLFFLRLASVSTTCRPTFCAKSRV